MTYHVYDPNHDGNGVIHSTESLEEALETARDALKNYRDQARQDGEWDLSVEELTVYEGAHPIPEDADIKEYTEIASAKPCNVIERPDDTDDTGYSESLGLSFGSSDNICDYEMKSKES